MYLQLFYHSLHMYYILFSLHSLSYSSFQKWVVTSFPSPLSNLNLYNSSAATDSVPSFHFLKKHLIKTAPLC